MIDEITGRMYAEVGGKLHLIPEIASHQHKEEPALTPKTIEQDQASARERALGEELAQQTPILGERTGTASPRIAETNLSVVGGSRGIAHTGRDTQDTATECRDRDSQIVGVIRPVASQPPMPHGMEEIREPDVEFDWEDETVEQWAYVR